MNHNKEQNNFKKTNFFKINKIEKELIDLSEKILINKKVFFYADSPLPPPSSSPPVASPPPSSSLPPPP